MSSILYMSPESLRKDNNNEANALAGNKISDIWSLACIILFCFTKEHPFMAEYGRGEDILFKI